MWTKNHARSNWIKPFGFKIWKINLLQRSKIKLITFSSWNPRVVLSSHWTTMSTDKPKKSDKKSTTDGGSSKKDKSSTTDKKKSSKDKEPTKHEKKESTSKTSDKKKSISSKPQGVPEILKKEFNEWKKAKKSGISMFALSILFFLPPLLILVLFSFHFLFHSHNLLISFRMGWNHSSRPCD